MREKETCVDLMFKNTCTCRCCKNQGSIYMYIITVKTKALQNCSKLIRANDNLRLPNTDSVSALL